jgi:uncharacterized repeat protein (TIGR03803 family)
MKMSIMRPVLLAVALGILFWPFRDQASAQTFTTLHSFTATTSLDINSDGATPLAALILSSNRLYGTTYRGGSGGRGTAFSVRTDGAGFAVIHNFTFPEAIHPLANLILSGTTFFGTTTGGGSLGGGTVFSIDTDGTGFMDLYDFPNAGNGGFPGAGLILSADTLYGTTEGGTPGSPSEGTVFAVNTNGTGLSLLYNFSGADGSDPIASLTLSGKTLFGTTSSGGNSDLGTVFAINTDGTEFRTLRNFTGGDDGGGPSGNLVLSGTTLFGITQGGGASGNGTVFAINTDGSGFTNLYSFTARSASAPYTNSDGTFPLAGLTLVGKTLFGTASRGGVFGSGTVFAINTDGTGFKVLYTFTSISGSANSDGAIPQSSLVFGGGTFYGTTSAGGRSGNGTVFSLSLAASSPPQLTITASETSVVLAWSTNFWGFSLQSTTNLGPSAIWTTNFPGPIVVNGLNTVTHPTTGRQQFFRLAR